MPRQYTVSFGATTVTAANGDYDLFEFAAARDTAIELVSVELGGSGTADYGDGQEEGLRLAIVRGNTTSGNGTATTPRPPSPLDAAALFTAETLGSTPASAGTAIDLWTGAWNVRAPGPIFPPIPQGFGHWTRGGASPELLCVRLLAAVADDITISGVATLIEYP